jgi:ABC-2 type transport system permease protein
VQSILAVAWKDLKLMSRDRLGMFFIIVFPLFMGIFFGAISGSFGSSGPRMTVAVDDQDQSVFSGKFVVAIESNKGIKVVALPRAEAMERVRKGKLTGMLVIPQGFGETAGVLWADPPEIELGIDPSRQAEAGMLEGLVMQSVGSLVSERFQDLDSMRSTIQTTKDEISAAEDMPLATKLAVQAIMGSLDGLMDAVESTQQAADEDGVVARMAGGQLAEIKSLDVTRQLDPDSIGALVKKLRSKWDISFPQAMLWGVLGCVAGFAVLTVRERSVGTLVRLQLAPMPRWAILAGKGLACFLAVLAVIAGITAAGYGLGMRPRRWDLLVMAALCTAACFVGIMMLISVVGKTESAVGGASWGLNLLMAMFGGGMIPIAFMPGFMKTFSNFSPVKWSILALEGAIWRDFSLAEMVGPCAVLLAVAAVGVMAGSIVLRRQLRGA